MISSRWREGYLRDRGSTSEAVHVWCGVAKCQRVFVCEDELNVLA